MQLSSGGASPPGTMGECGFHLPPFPEEVSASAARSPSSARRKPLSSAKETGTPGEIPQSPSPLPRKRPTCWPQGLNPQQQEAVESLDPVASRWWPAQPPAKPRPWWPGWSTSSGEEGSNPKRSPAVTFTSQAAR